MRVIILTDSIAEQFLPIAVYRLRSFGISDIWISRSYYPSDENCHVDGAILFKPKDNFYGIDQFFSCRELWRSSDSEPVIFLYGNVYYPHCFIRMLIEKECEDFLYFQRTRKNSTSIEDLALKVVKKEDFFMKLCQLRSELVLGKIKDEYHQVQGYLDGNGMGPYYGIGSHGIEFT